MKKIGPGKVKLIYAGFVIVGIIILLLSAKYESDLGIYAGCGVIVLGIIFHFVFFRCPYCGKSLSRAQLKMSLKFCPYCGQNLEDEVAWKSILSKKDKEKPKED